MFSYGLLVVLGACQGEPRPEAPEEVLWGVPPTVEELEQACKADEILACHNLAYAMLGQEKCDEREKRIRLFERVCRYGYADACFQASQEHLGNKNPDEFTGISILSKTCELGNGGSCYQLGKRIMESSPVESAGAFKKQELLGRGTGLLRILLMRDVEPPEVEVLPWLLHCVDHARLEPEWLELETECLAQQHPLCQSEAEPWEQPPLPPTPDVSQRAALKDALEGCKFSREECLRAGEIEYQRFIADAQSQERDPLLHTDPTAITWLVHACYVEHPGACHHLGNIAYRHEACSLAEASFRRARFPEEYYGITIVLGIRNEYLEGSRRNWGRGLQ